jgi:hypothetical protein
VVAGACGGGNTTAEHNDFGGGVVAKDVDCGTTGSEARAQQTCT